MKFALALLLALAATPALGQELRPAEPSVLYFVSLPFDGASRRDREPLLGFAFQGKRHYESFRMDTRILNLAGSGFEVKYLIIGAVAAGAAVAMGGSDASTEAQRAQQAEAQQYVAANPPPPCPATCFGLRRF
jgi:hypothetical protein